MPELRSVQEQARGLSRLANQAPLRVLAIASGKGGVGKSNLTVNIGRICASRGQAVMLMDADLGLANLDVLLGVRPRYDLYHVISGQRSLEEVVVRTPGDLMLVPAASGVERMAALQPAEHASLIRSFSEMSLPVDVLLIDTAAGINDSVVAFSQASQEVIVVVCDEPASITDAYALIKVLSRDKGVTRFQVVANMVDGASHGLRLYEQLSRVCDQYLQVTPGYLGHIPYDDALRAAVRRRTPVVDAFPASRAVMALQRIVDQLEDLPTARSGSGRIEFFLERMLQAQIPQGQDSQAQGAAALGSQESTV